MESYSLTGKRSAAKELRNLPRDVIVRILNAVEKLLPRQPDFDGKTIRGSHPCEGRDPSNLKGFWIPAFAGMTSSFKCTHQIHHDKVLAENPYPPGVRKLSGAQHTYRIRVGDYRIIFSVFAAELVIEIIKVGHRKDVYDR